MKRRALIFLSGCVCFFVSQPLLRLPLLDYLQGTSRFILFSTLNPLITGILIAFSAGIFEEGFRFIFRNFFLKSAKMNITEPIIFGLGHGLTEAFLVLAPAISVVAIGDLSLGILERILAVILHVGLSVIVWNGFQRNKKYRYLLFAILVHGMTNSLIPLLNRFDNFVLLILGSLVVIDIAIIFYMLRSRKFYTTEERT